MVSFEELVASQKQTGEKIEAIIRNYKKDPVSRKTSISYFQERLRRLDEEWAVFETTDNKIRLLDNIPLEHKYFTEEYYSAIMELVQKYKEEFEQSIASPVDKEPITRQQHHQKAAIEVPTLETGELRKLMRRQTAIMTSLDRRLNMGDFSSHDVTTAEKLWQNIEDLHYQIAEMCDDVVSHGYDMNRFTRLEDRLRTACRTVAINESTNHNSSDENNRSQFDAMPISKITIPRFDGNYLKWQEFHDLFSSLIIKQSMPKVQKIWYLKTHLVGEAGNLIKHFTASGENFDDAWDLVVDRYNNKRLLVSKLVQNLVDSPIKPANDNYKTLHDKTQECLLALKNLKIDTSTWDPLLLHLLLKRLDNSTRLRYEQSLIQPREIPTVKEFLEFLEKHFQSMEALSEKREPSKSRVCTSITTNQASNSCIMCKNGQHPLFACTKFLQSSIPSRLQFIQKQRYCVNCLKPGHNSKTCISSGCRKCNKKHNTLLHLESSKQDLNQSIQLTNTIPKKDTSLAGNQCAISLTTFNQSKVPSYVLLSTAMVNIRANEKEIQCRALLDSGSQLNFVSERLIKRLGISPKPTSICISGIGSSNTRVQHRVNVALHSRINNYTSRLEAAVLPHIISPQPSQVINIDHWPIPKNIMLADPKFNRPDKIDVLLGAEFYHQLLSGGQIKLGSDLPMLNNTLLGWVIAGKIEGHESSTTTCGMCTEEETNLEEAIARLWEMESISTSDRCLSGSERQCENHFLQTHTIDKNGRFIVRIPFCSDSNTLGDSQRVALNRFLALERRLSQTPEIKAQYTNFMKEYEELGHMSQIDLDSIMAPNYFIPHHCVLKPDSLTTKLRVVFDASTKTSTGVSLNEMMFTGPTIQSELFSILLRFRRPRFVFTTDIKKMYRQIMMHPDDRKFQIIIWRENPAMPITYYKLNTVTYGTRAAPYLATKCLEQIGKANMTRYPQGAQFLLENFYVDDGIGGEDDLQTALAIQSELQHILNKHGFELQKWAANHQKLLQNVVEEQQEVNFDFNSDNSHFVKTLGLTWMPKQDQLCVKVCLRELNRVTKRTVSSDLASLFDPLGLLSPIVVTAKIFIQDLWQKKLDWDAALPENLQTTWVTFRQELEHIKDLRITRHIFEGHKPTNIQIHAFADASERAYGAAVYIRSTTKNKQVIVRLLCAKSRVAPLKRQTLPRLELCASLLSAQLTARVKQDLKLNDVPTYLWTDSEIVLAWINSQSSSYQTFVANRIAAIQELSIAEQWRHVSSKDNPADILSRGLSPRKLASSSLWFYGPIFLHGQQEMWPKEFSKANSIDPIFDIERKKVAAISTANDSSHSIIYNIKHNGSFRTLQRVVGYIVRFINKTRKRNQESRLALSVQELEQALVVIVRAIQQSDFDEELKHLMKYKQVNKNSPYINLTPFLDTNGIIRVGGRLESSELPYDAKHQMLIPYNDPISKMLMQMVHEQNRHCGPQALLSHLRQRYWPVKGKSAVRSIVKHCIKCTRANPQLLNQIMGNLPSTRVIPARPFINSGVDFCGPFWVHHKVRGKRPQKAYIAVFCCFATKAVHLELVSDLTTEAFIGALKRFISRRGHCKNLYCDNATNFVGAKNQLNELSEALYSTTAQDDINKECIVRGITFHFIPPRAPHFGGLWEAAVKSAKHLLIRSVATASLTYEELDTVVIEIEGILNSRPISPMSDNPNDLAALTPGHFLIGEPLNAQVDIHAKQSKINLLTRWKLVSHLKMEFWKRWSREYLCELQYRHKWQTQKNNIKAGDMVIIKEDNTTPLKWPLGRIVKVHYGDDGIIRVVDIKTSNGVCRRPISRLAPLPVNDTEAKEGSAASDDDKPTTSKITNTEVPEKKRRTSINHTIVTVIMALVFLPLVLGEQIQYKRFGNRLGLHFEGIGSAAISSTEWQLLVYYDLKEFWSEATIFSQGTKNLNHLCKQLQDNTTCANLVKYFEHTEAELKLDSTLLSGRIHKRAAIDLVGNIAHSLFGVLDSEYAKEMALKISQVKENEKHLLDLLKNQTSIIDATINIMKSNEAEVKERFDHIDFQIEQMHNRIHDEQHQEKIYHIFSSLCVQLTITAARLQQTQSSILDILTNTHHGIISPLLLTPHQLQQEVRKIKMHLSESLELPVNQEDTLQLYKLMKVKGGLTNSTVVFNIILPLVERDRYDIFNLVPIPIWINDTLLALRPCADLLIINSARDQYLTISHSELNACSLITENRYLCSKGQTRHQRGSSTCDCDLNLLHNTTQSDCPVQQIKDNTVWIALQHRNKWIYALSTPSQVTAVCKNKITEFTLDGSGLLILGPECILKHKSTILHGQDIISSEIETSYTSFWEITPQRHEERIKPLLPKNDTNQYSSQIKNLTALQTSLATQILELPNTIESHNYHHTTVGYTALVIAFSVVIYLLVKQKLRLRSTPIPAPRMQPTDSEFTVHI